MYRVWTHILLKYQLSYYHDIFNYYTLISRRIGVFYNINFEKIACKQWV